MKSITLRGLPHPVSNEVYDYIHAVEEERMMAVARMIVAEEKTRDLVDELAEANSLALRQGLIIKGLQDVVRDLKKDIYRYQRLDRKSVV